MITYMWFSMVDTNTWGVQVIICVVCERFLISDKMEVEGGCVYLLSAFGQ